MYVEYVCEIIVAIENSILNCVLAFSQQKTTIKHVTSHCFIDPIYSLSCYLNFF